jgi:hypothetical protein
MTIRSVVVTGNCNVGGIVDGLNAVLDGVEVRGVPSWELETPAQIAEVADAIAASDVWARMPLSANEAIESRVQPRLVIDLPNVVFSAFHPDAIYAVRGDGSLFRGLTDYHSAIGLWAWRQGFAPDAAAALFTPEVMRFLTYDRYWEPSVAAMKADFAQSSLAFPPFWMRLKRKGVFMHTINHPTGPTLALLAKAMAVRLGASEEVWDVPAERYIQDFLTDIVWPVYPWVGESLGVPGCFRWKMDGRTFGGVEEWLEATWNAYGDTPRDDVMSHRIDDGVYERVLGAAADAVGLRSAA